MYGYQQNYGMQQGTGFVNPYLDRLQAMSQPQMQMQMQAPLQPTQITRVNGRNGADAFQMAPNSAILLLDETAPIIWLKQTDGAGYATVTPYSITPYQAAPEPDFNSLEARIQRLEEILNGKSNSAGTRTAADGPAASAGTGE